MKISVLIPTYNRSKFVIQAIDSVLAQTVTCDKIIIVDDGSTDNTDEVLASYGNKITVIKQDNRGVSAARNTGINAAQGEWAWEDEPNKGMLPKVMCESGRVTLYEYQKPRK